MRKIKIHLRDQQWTAELFDTPTSQAILQVLPIIADVNTWGNEIYFPIDTSTDLEPSAIVEVKIGELAYWPSLPAFCIFFGPTPASTNSTPRAASAVNVFGRLIDPDIQILQTVQAGDRVEVYLGE